MEDFKFIYIDQFRKVENCQFNFSTEFNIEFNPERNELTIEPNPKPIIPNYFGENIVNVNAIIGENRSGKTSMVELLSSYLINHYTNPIFIIGNSVYYNNNIRLKVPKITGASAELFNPIPLFGKRPFRNKDAEDIEENFCLILVSNSHFQRSWMVNKHTIDMTTAKLLETDFKPRHPEKNVTQVNLHRNEELRRNISLLNWADNWEHELPFKANLQDVGVSFNAAHPFDTYNASKTNKQVFELCQNRINPFIESIPYGDSYIPNPNTNFAKECIGISVILYLVSYGAKIENYKTSNLNNDFFGFYSSILDAIKLENLKYSKESFIQFLSFIDNLKPEDFNVTVRLFEGRRFDLEEVIGPNVQYFFNRRVVEELIEMKAHTDVSGTMYDFYWGLSAGEHAFLNILSRIYEASKSLVKANLEGFSGFKNVLLVLDEPTLHFHPEWERNFINYLVKYTPQILQGFFVQIVFTTHSSLTISDLPTENVLLMQGKTTNTKKQNSDFKTLANDSQNIYFESFGVKDPFMGEFTRKKMEEYFAPIIEGKKPNAEQRTQMIEFAKMIGDPIIREKLISLAKSKS